MKSWLYRLLRFLFFSRPKKLTPQEEIIKTLRVLKTKQAEQILYPKPQANELGKQLVRKNQRLTVKKGGKK